MNKLITMLLFICCMLWLCGCVLTTGRYKPASADQPTVSFWRIAVLYPFAIEDVILPGGIRIARYGTDGGAPGIATIIDSAGNVYNTVKRP